MIDALIRDNRRLLEQGLELLQDLPPGLYSDAANALSGGAIGAHLRHVLDHYLCLLRSLPEGLVDYEARDRDPRIEVDRTHAAAATQDLIDALVDLEGSPSVGLDVALHAGRCAELDLGATSSSLGRELQFALLHTVHHYAIIGMELRHRGLDCPDDFGLAPATRGYRKASA